MSKKIVVPDSFNFCDPADWCDFFDLPGETESDTNEYPRINATERMKVIKEVIDKSNYSDASKKVDLTQKKTITHKGE
jgi:hypothetical protein